MAEAKQAPQIVAYLKPQCGWSRGVRAVFYKYGLKFEDKDIINYPENYDEMVRKSGQPLQPSVEIDGVMLADVSGEEVEAYLVDQGYQPIKEDPGVPTDRACEDHEHQAQAQPVFFDPKFGR